MSSDFENGIVTLMMSVHTAKHFKILSEVIMFHGKPFFKSEVAEFISQL